MANLKPIRSTLSHFYKYSDPDHPEWLQTIILKHEIYFPKLSELNDPADGKPKLAPLSSDQMVAFLLVDFIRRHPGLTPEAQGREARMIRLVVDKYGLEECFRRFVRMLNQRLDDHRIYSLSKRYDNMSLWAKYAGNHRGYCLEFANQGPFESAYEVMYGPTITIDVSDPETLDPRLFFCKSPDWSNEEEVRILLTSDSEPIVKIEPQILTRLILGKNMSEVHRTTIRKWGRQRNPELLIVSAEYDELHHGLALKP